MILFDILKKPQLEPFTTLLPHEHDDILYTWHITSSVPTNRSSWARVEALLVRRHDLVAAAGTIAHYEVNLSAIDSLVSVLTGDSRA